MTTYGILITDTNWTNQDKVEIDKTAYLRHKDELVKGAHVLIYVREPVDAIVAEAEVSGDIVEARTASPEPNFNAATPANTYPERELDPIHSTTDAPAMKEGSPSMANTYFVPLKITRLKGKTPQIQLGQLQRSLGSDFSVFDETWIPLSKQAYKAITAEWEKEKTS